MAKQFNFTFPENILFSVRKAIVLPIAISILTVISGCNSSDPGSVETKDVPTASNGPTTSNDLASLQSAKTIWNSHSGQFYSIESQRFCQCVAEMSAQMKISVSDNLILSAFDIGSDEEISKEIREEVQTIDSLFVLIENAIADGISIEVTYNEVYGYPETAKINLEQLAVDGGLYIELSNLQIKNSLLALNDVTWSLESFDSIAGPQPIIANTNISLSIDMQNMQLIGVGGCNSYSADFVLDNTKNDITISNVISTEKACLEPENIMQQEQSYFATLSQIRFFTFDDTILNMVVGADDGLHFVAAQHSIAGTVIAASSHDITLLQSAKTKWDSISGQYYTVQSQRSCECEDEVSAQMEISVLENSVLSAISLDSGEAISKKIHKEILTVDGLFALIEKALADGISIEVTYNEEYGYPETAKIDLERLAVDGGLHINLSNLEFKDSKFALDDVIWSLGSFDGIAGSQPIIENSNISLSIDMVNMQLSGFGGCNNYSADFVLVDGKHNITISNVIGTEIACSKPESIMQQEMSYFATLAQVRFFNFGDATLNMVVGGDSGLHFVIAD